MDVQVVRPSAIADCAQVQNPRLHLHHRCGCRGGMQKYPEKMRGPGQTRDSKLAT